MLRPPWPMPGTRLARVARRCDRMAESRVFEVFIILVIGANALLLAVETYPYPASAVSSPWPW